MGVKMRGRARQPGMISVTRAVLVVTLCLILGACGPGLIQTRPDAGELPDEYGLVAIKVITNARSLEGPLENWTSAFVVDLHDEEKRYELEASTEGLSSARVFVGALPPGDYAIYNLQSYQKQGDVSRWMNAPVPRSTGTFTVEDRRITSLGSLVYHSLGEVEVQGRAQRLYLLPRLDEDEDMLDFIADSFPDAFGEMNQDFLLGWDPLDTTDLVDERLEMAKRIRSFAVGLNFHWLGEDEIVMTGAMGQIFHRAGESEWNRTDTGQNRQLLSLVGHGDGYLAGGERGLMMRADSLEGPWEKLPGPGEREGIYWLDSNPEGGVHALTRRDGRVTLYRLDQELSDWQDLWQYEYRPGMFFTGAGHVHATASDSGSIFVFGDQSRLEFTPENDTPEVHSSRNFFSWTKQPDGTIVGVPGHWWSGTSSPEFSTDNGRSWTDVESSPAIERLRHPRRSKPILVSESEVLAFARREIRHQESLRRLSYEDEYRLRLFQDGEDIVYWGEPVDEDCTELLGAISTPSLVFATCEDGRIYRTEDGGMEWILDFEPGQELDEDDDLLDPEEVVARVESSIHDWLPVPFRQPPNQSG